MGGCKWRRNLNPACGWYCQKFYENGKRKIMKPHPALVYGRVIARAGYGATRKRWAQAEVTEGSWVKA
jgi:hypothetical protein